MPNTCSATAHERVGGSAGRAPGTLNFLSGNVKWRHRIGAGIVIAIDAVTKARLNAILNTVVDSGHRVDAFDRVTGLTHPCLTRKPLRSLSFSRIHLHWLGLRLHRLFESRVGGQPADILCRCRPGSNQERCHQANINAHRSVHRLAGSKPYHRPPIHCQRYTVTLRVEAEHCRPVPISRRSHRRSVQSVSDIGPDNHPSR